MEPPQPVSFPKLEVLDPSVPRTFIRPVKRIHDGPDVAHFLTSKGYRDIGLFVLQLNRAMCPRKSQQTQTSTPSTSSNPDKPKPPRISALSSGPPPRTFTLDKRGDDPASVVALRTLLDRVEELIDKAPPDPGPRRFGNVSFRKWYGLVEEQIDGLLSTELYPKIPGFGSTEGGNNESVSSSEELKAYFFGGFGSSQRLDYGTGHELSFLAFLGCLWKLGFFKDDPQDGSIERSIVLGVIERYLQVVRRLILTYTLEPAGSHGVWGLDDHSFISYIFGSAQLARPISENETMPTEGSVPGAPKPADVVKATSVELYRESNMYFSAIGFINDVKKGPFWEHSPILFDISGIKDGWGKINKGMIKMFNAEVLSKFPVVQHFPFGSLFSWDTDPDASVPAQSVHMANQPVAAAATAAATGTPPPPGPVPGPGGSGTAAPWARATSMPGSRAGTGSAGIPYSRAPWASAGSGTQATAPRNTPNTGPPPPSSFAAGQRGTTSAQHTVTKAPWAKD